VVEPVGRIWDEEEHGPEADALFTVIILGEEPVNKKNTRQIQNSILTTLQIYCYGHREKYISKTSHRTGKKVTGG
jgi:hypothetical protein